MSDELEPEILSYREFQKREALRAWDRRRRAFEASVGRRVSERDLRPRERRFAEPDAAHR